MEYQKIHKNKSWNTKNKSRNKRISRGIQKISCRNKTNLRKTKITHGNKSKSLPTKYLFQITAKKSWHITDIMFGETTWPAKTKIFSPPRRANNVEKVVMKFYHVCRYCILIWHACTYTQVLCVSPQMMLSTNVKVYFGNAQQCFPYRFMGKVIFNFSQSYLALIHSLPINYNLHQFNDAIIDTDSRFCTKNYSTACDNHNYNHALHIPGQLAHLLTKLMKQWIISDNNANRLNCTERI